MSRVSVTTLINRSNRNMGNVHSAVKSRVLRIIRQAYDEGINVQISSGYRSNAEQQQLFNKGRSAPGNIVTNARPGQSVHNYGLAVDYFLVSKDGNDSIWTVNSGWRRVADIAKGLGFSWGGDWTSFKDYPHLELTGGLGWRELKAGERPHHLLTAVKGVSTSTDILEPGEGGKAVTSLQKKLIEAGLDLDKYGADGDYGKETENAVRMFQKRHGLTVDGIAGEQTITKLEEVINMTKTGFKDVNPESTLAAEIKKAKDYGISKGVGGGEFNPDEKVTRAEAAVFAVRAYEKALEAMKK